jgi:hypothetical protein
MSQQLTLIETAPQTTETPKGSSQTHRRFGIVAMVMTAAVLVALSLLYTQIARTVPANSDDASIVLEAADVLHGNSWLHGWTKCPRSSMRSPFWAQCGSRAGGRAAALRDGGGPSRLS